ncbi:MAG: hypothetical protein GKS05_06320 [Nitrospirales bacterium]|nr:hypothetical protein [Nitrospirales bacterium]
MASRSSQDPSTRSTPSRKPETELLNVVVEREGKNVTAKWGLHPTLREELQPEEWKELTDIMGKVANLVGSRFSQVLTQNEKESTGTA